MVFDSIGSYIVIPAIAGASLVPGPLFGFSKLIMRPLAELTPEHGMVAMQQIKKILNPLFLVFFLGTPILCLMITGYCLFHLNIAHSVYLLLGSIGYIIGPFGITVRRNIPLNDKLAAAQPMDRSEVWDHYQVNWQRCNHIRTYIGLGSIMLLCVGLRMA